jgi:AcrR family transcriptional regulator
MVHHQQETGQSGPPVDLKPPQVDAMTDMPTKLKVRALRKSAKRNEKKRQIAESAINALQELGYANTSLRDIAAKSGMSLGILHYYFEDRSDLIIYCVKTYKRDFVDGIITALDGATDRSTVIDTLSGALAVSIVKDAKTHRLWYDILAFARSGHTEPPMIDIQYALLDGVFRYLLQGQLKGTNDSDSAIKKVFASVLEQVL